MNKARRNAAKKRRKINRTLAPLMRAESYFATMRDNTRRITDRVWDGIEKACGAIEGIRRTFPAKLTMTFEANKP